MADQLTAEVIAVLNDRAADAAARRLETRFAAAGKVSADEFSKTFESELKRSNLAADDLGRALQQRMERHGAQSGRGFGSSFGSELAQSLPGVSGFASAMNGYEGAAGKMGAVAGRALGLAFTTAAAGLIGAAGYTLFKGFERYEAIDAATNRLTNLNRTLEQTGRATIDVGAVMSTVNDVVQDTPFALDKAFSVATQALSSNTGDLNRFMTNVADTAAYLQQPIDSVGKAFLDVAANGKVGMQQLSNELQGIPLDWFAQAMGKSTAEISKMMEKGQVGLADLMKVVESNVSGFAKGSVDTLSGAMEQANTAVARLGANLLGALFGAPADEANTLKDAIKAVTDRLNEVNAWVTAHQDEIRKAFEDGVQAAKDLASAAQTIIDLLGKIGVGADDVVKAFVAWKAIQGVSALSTAVGGIGTALSTALPAAAATGAAGISSALASVAIPTWLGWVIANKSSEWLFANDPLNGLAPQRVLPNQSNALDGTPRPGSNIPIPGTAPAPTVHGIPSVGGIPIPGLQSTQTPQPGQQITSLPLIPGQGLHWEDGKGWVSDKPGATPAAPGGPAPAGGPILPPPGADGSGSGPRLPAAPVVPMAALPGIDPRLQMTAGLMSAQGSLQDARTRVAEKEARVNQLRADNNATAEDILNAENEAAKARREAQEANMRFTEAQQNAFEQQNKQLKQMSSAMSDFGAQLDSDFGISDGLAGIADNLVRFVASLAAAPLVGQLSAISNAHGDEGSGLMGILGSTGALGPRFLPGAGGSSGSAGLSSGGYGGGGAYPGDAALLSGVPAGRYSQSGSADLTQGLGDCSSAVEDLVNIIDGRPTGGRSMSTGNADEWLASRGFIPGMGGAGDFRVGYNSGHMQATLPGGTPFNWGSDASAANRGIGGTGADDPSFTDHWFRPGGAGAGGGGPVTASLSPSGGGVTSVFVVNMPGGGISATTPSAPSAPSAPRTPSATPTPSASATPPVSTSPWSDGTVGSNPVAPDAVRADYSSPFVPVGGAPLPALGSMPGGGGGGSLPGVGMVPQSTGPGGGIPGLPAVNGVGGAAGQSLGGQSYPAGPAGGGLGLGGMAMDGLMAATSGLDMMAPGAGAAAKIGIQVANRTAKYGGQVAGILTSGFLDTITPAGDNPKASIGNSWFGKLAGGIAGASAALPNAAGGKPPGPMGGQGQQGGQGGNTINNTLNMTNNRTTEDFAGNQAVREMGAANWNVPGRQ